MEQALTSQTQKNLYDNRQHDSLRDIVKQKKSEQKMNSFKVKKKDKDKRLSGDRVQQIQLNSKQIVAIYDQEEFASPPMSPSTDLNVQE